MKDWKFQDTRVVAPGNSQKWAYFCPCEGHLCQLCSQRASGVSCTVALRHILKNYQEKWECVRTTSSPGRNVGFGNRRAFVGILAAVLLTIWNQKSQLTVWEFLLKLYNKTSLEEWVELMVCMVPVLLQCQWMLEEVMEREWPLRDPLAGPGQSEAPHSLPCPWSVGSAHWSHTRRHFQGHILNTIVCPGGLWVVDMTECS